ncbi:MAG: hypothetical protein KJZ80_11380 [Hyphomicrobiaceae bacterium]|nr:hypothetical protein [Hyphomicrobiaceae bacterium]
MSAAEATSERVEKLMALSEREFSKSIAALLPSGAAIVARCAVVPLQTGQATITYEALPSVRLGQSLELPRARVVLTFTGVGIAEREAFLARFDVAFQRGGG